MGNVVGRITSFGGVVILLAVCVALSSNPRKISFRAVLGGLILQFLFAVLVLTTSPGFAAASFVGSLFDSVLSASHSGTMFVFGFPTDISLISPSSSSTDPTMSGSSLTVPNNLLLNTFAFGILPTIITFSSLMSVVYYLGIMDFVMKFLARFTAWTLGTSGAESLSCICNIVLGQTEAPLVIRPFLSTLTKSEITAVMVGGFSTISGGLMAALVSMGIDASHLVTASFISAPAALMIAKILEPETEKPKTLGKSDFELEKPGSNVFEAAALGSSDGLQLALNIGGIVVSYTALMALMDNIIHKLGSLIEQGWSISGIISILFYPMAFVMGIPSEDLRISAELLGTKLILNEFVAYSKLGRVKTELNPRTFTIMTYALCGFSNFVSIGVQLSCLGLLAPNKRPIMAQVALKAMVGGFIACNLTACIAGILLP